MSEHSLNSPEEDIMKCFNLFGLSLNIMWHEHTTKNVWRQAYGLYIENSNKPIVCFFGRVV